MTTIQHDQQASHFTVFPALNNTPPKDIGAIAEMNCKWLMTRMECGNADQDSLLNTYNAPAGQHMREAPHLCNGNDVIQDLSAQCWPNK
jgi:hypothetical protein